MNVIVSGILLVTVVVIVRFVIVGFVIVVGIMSMRAGHSMHVVVFAMVVPFFGCRCGVVFSIVSMIVGVFLVVVKMCVSLVHVALGGVIYIGDN